MSSDEIVVEGVTYVSSKRASDISAYAQDYIGQLARKNLIRGKRIGGLWYVDMSSLESYKVSETEVTTENNNLGSNDYTQESALLFDGRSYISANRASKITGYNQDYVGQLARLGKINSRQVGNRWFIDREGILIHKKEKDSLLAAVQSESVGVPKSVQGVPSPLVHAPEPQLLKYMSEDGDLSPRLTTEEGAPLMNHSIPTHESEMLENE